MLSVVERALGAFSVWVFARSDLLERGAIDWGRMPTGLGMIRKKGTTRTCALSRTPCQYGDRDMR